MSDLIGNLEDRCSDGGTLVLIAPVPGHCLPFTILMTRLVDSRLHRFSFIILNCKNGLAFEQSG